MFDVVIIGAGVTGSAIAREVSRYKLNTCVIEKEEDVCNETSKANSAIIHAGFDAVPGTMKAKLNVMGNAMMDRIAEELDIPFKRNGSLVVCTKEQDPEGLQGLMERGKNYCPVLPYLSSSSFHFCYCLFSDSICRFLKTAHMPLCIWAIFLNLLYNFFILQLFYRSSSTFYQIIKCFLDCVIIVCR